MMTYFSRKCKHLFICSLLALAGCSGGGAYEQPQDNAGGQTGMQAGAYRPQTYPTPGRMPVNRAGMGGSSMDAGSGQSVKIALLVPLSGEASKLGNMLLDGATLGLFDKYNSLPPRARKTSIVLLPKDAGSTPREAALAAQQAIEEGAQLIIGPLFAKSVQAVAPIAAQKGISVISFSNDKSVAGNGVYNFGFLPEQQVERITEYMMTSGFEHIGALLPNNDYGTMLGHRLSEIAAVRSRHIDPMEFYAPSQQSLDGAVRQLLAKSIAGGSNFQALFLAEAEGRLQQIAKALRAQGMDTAKLRLIGTGTFDNADFIRDPNLSGSVFASASPKNYQTFEQRFYAEYNYRPVRLAGLAYDAVALAATLTLANSTPDFSKEALVNRSGFMGPANGIFRFRPDGTTERGLAVIEITPAGFVERDPAPDAF